MPDTDVLVSELTQASAINTNDLMLITQPDAESQTGYASRKGTVLQTATKMLKGIEFTTDLPHLTDKTVLGALEELSTGKANTSGEYNGLISGQANALKPSARLENKTPYLYRPSYANGYGYETLIGGTCGVNQLVTNGATSPIILNDITATKNADNSWDISGTASDNTTINIDGVGWELGDNHVYLIAGSFSGGSPSTFAFGLGGLALDFGGGTIWKNTNHYTNTFAGFVVGNGVNVNLTNVFFRIHDLTQMFGTTIADYVYTLESGTSGAGITWIKNNGFFTADYYPYNAGGLLSVKTSKKITTGKNQLNYDAWKNVGVVGGTTVWENNGVTITANQADAYTNWTSDVFPNGAKVAISEGETITLSWEETTNKNGSVYIFPNCNVEGLVAIDNAIAKKLTYTATAGVNFVSFRFGVAYQGDTISYKNIQIEYGSTATAYEPYITHEYDLSGNRKVHRVFGIVDLGSLEWNYNSGWSCWVSDLPLAKVLNNTTAINGISDKFTIEMASGYTSGSSPNSLAVNTSYMLLCNNESDSNSPTGYLVYELATPFDETVNNPELRGVLKLDSNNNLYYYGDTCSDFTNPMIVDGNGTEEFIDGRTVEMPVGHSTIYVDDNDATKLENLPDISNDGNGTYLVNQFNGQLSLAKYGIPNPPTTDGSYRLEVTVTDGVPTYTWEVIS